MGTVYSSGNNERTGLGVAVKGRAVRAAAFVLFVAGGLLLFLFGNNWISVFPTNGSTAYKWGLAVFFLALAVILRRSERFHGYWQIAFALFIASCGIVLNWHLGNWLGRLLPRAGSEMQSLAIEKFSESTVVVGCILLLTLLSRNDLGSIFLKRGDLRWGLRFGLISFGVCAALFTAIAVWQSGGPRTEGLFASGVALSTLVAAIPWILIFVFANSLMEELWFRGIFLKRLSPVLGAGAAAVATTIIFASLHAAGTYITAAERVIFPAIVFALGYLNARVMLKTDSILGSVFLHAGYDLMVIIPLLV